MTERKLFLVNRQEETREPSEKLSLGTVKLSPEVFQMAAEAGRTGIIITGSFKEDCPILYANPFFLELTGYDHQEVIGKNCRFLQGPETSTQTTEKIREALGSGREFRGTLLNYRKDGTSFWNRLTLSPIRVGSGEVRYFLGFQEDLSEQIATEQERDRAVSQLKETNEELVRFAETIAHDLKAPLRGVRSFSELLSRKCAEVVDKEGQEYLRFIVDGIRRMDDLIQSVLAYSKAGRVQMKAEVNLADLLQNVIASLGPDAPHSIRILSALPTMTCDPTRMTQVFQNLLSNALKYGTPAKGDIEVSCKLKNNLWWFSVQDHGPGIPADKLPLIFRPLYTLHPEDPNSTGLGLSLVKKIVELHGGEVEVRSILGEGTTFLFSIPNSRNNAEAKTNSLSDQSISTTPDEIEEVYQR